MNNTPPDKEIQALRQEQARLRDRIAALEDQFRAHIQSPELPSPVSHLPGIPRNPPTAAPPLSFEPPARPSLESRIGSQLFNRVGIVAVLLGVAWFLKYAVDRHWLGDAARVAIGLAAGLGLIGWSERFRARGFPVFSFSLKAVGTGILYLSLWAASALFGLIPYGVALLGMALVTAGNAWLCLTQRSQVLAAYALTGGFLTPTLLGLGHDSPAQLGLYLILLNAGLLALLLLRRWPRLLPAAFAGTIAYLLWLGLTGDTFHHAQPGVSLALGIFFFIAFSLAAVFLIEPDAEAQRLASATAIANATAGGLALWLLLGALHPSSSPVPPHHPSGLPGLDLRDWIGCLEALWFAALLALRRLRRTDLHTLAAVHAGLVVALAAAGMWLALSRTGLVAGLACESAVLLALSLRRSAGPATPVLGSPAAPVTLLGLASVALILQATFHLLPPAAHVLFNARFCLFILSAAAAIFGVRASALHHSGSRARQADPHLDRQADLSPARERAWTRAGRFFAILTTTLLLAAGIFEAHTGWGAASPMPFELTVSAWAAVLGIILLVIGFRVRWAFLRWQALALLTLAVAKLFLFDTRSLTQGYRIVSFLSLGILLLCVSFIYQRDLLNLRGKEHGGD